MKYIIATVAAVVILGISVFIALWFTMKDKEGDKNSIVYEKIEIWTEDQDEYLGSVWIEDDQIQSSVEEDEIADFIRKNSRSWESGVHEYPIGGMEDGMLWDGAKTASIKDDDFIIVIYVDLDDEFGDEYIIDLIEEGE